MDPDMVRQQFEEEAELKRRAESGAGAVSVTPPAEMPAGAVLTQTAAVAGPPVSPAGASAPLAIMPALPAVSKEAVAEPAPPAAAGKAAAIPAPVQTPQIRVPWAARAATAALGHVEGALAGQGLVLYAAGRLQFEPLHTLILTVLCAYLCAFFIAALFTAGPEFADRGRFLRSLGTGAMIAALGLEAALIRSGVLVNGHAALTDAAAWITYAAAAGAVFVILWPLNLFRLKRAAKQPG
jgi:hypothetical protein